jgi:hypothetical protein
MVELSYFALVLLISGCIAAGVVGGVVHTWNLRARIFSLENQVEVIAGRLTSEVRARAGQERWKKPDKDAELMANLIQQTPSRKKNWWEQLPTNKT